MSNLPLFQKQKQKPSYGTTIAADEETGPLLTAATSPGATTTTSIRTIGAVEVQVAETILVLFLQSSTDWRKEELNQHPKTSPKRPPEKRFKRHRNYYIWQLNQFRHWWKTSRLLVRLSGGYEYCLNPINWSAMGMYAVAKRKQGKQALRSMKAIGRGGVSRDFLKIVKPYTRSIRLFLAIARGYEARRDHRLIEVGMAEAFAFMGNRSFRWFARHFVDESTKQVFLPFSAVYIAPYLDHNSRPVIVTLGFLRAVLPFAVSFLGSRFGRQLTYNTYNVTHHRWRPVQDVAHFHPNAGAFQDTVLDKELLEIGHRVAETIGHGTVPEETREKLSSSLGFQVVGSGQGGYAVYRRLKPDRSTAIFLHVTPYGPSILGEMPRYVVLERKKFKSSTQSSSDVTIMDAAIQPEASIYGYTYSGAFFKNQEWAALRLKFEATLTEYQNACNRLKTSWSLRGKNAIFCPPSDLLTLKEFVRSGHTPKKARKDKRRWKELAKQVKKMSAVVAKYQKQGNAPKRVILYLEGLDCTAKSSTGGLICSALEDCGYVVKTAQHNRPPTPEQRQKPWMDRGRFEYPEDVYEEGERVPEYAALVWDRGPAGDFVYGRFSELNEQERMKKYDEFRQYDAKCRKEGVLFFKLLFVADKDSIASTLGKRLAHKHIVKDLRTWLDANSVEHFREGLEEIERHIDPTDFVAFNMYEQNLHIFTEFARNTDKMGPIGPWTVVNTCKRHPARLRLLQTFERELKKCAKKDDKDVAMHPIKKLISGKDDPVRLISIRAVIQIIVLLWLIWNYADITWKVDIMGMLYD